MGGAAQAAVVLSLTLGIALLSELYEFSSDLWLGTQEQLGPADTQRDLLVGFLGALVFVAVPKLISRLRSQVKPKGESPVGG